MKRRLLSASKWILIVAITLAAFWLLIIAIYDAGLVDVPNPSPSASAFASGAFAPVAFAQ